MTSMLLLARVTPVVLVCSIIVCEARGRVEQSRFVQELIGDSDHVNLRTPRTVDGFSVFWSPAAVTPFATANLLNYNHEYSEELGLSPPLTTDWSEPIPGTTPYAHNYGGHQFGHWAGQLGDGRAICVGELEDKKGQRLELCLKGAGKTAYSRRGDGRAVLRSSIREYLASEAMHALETTKRDPLYNGTVIDEKMAIVARVAPSFVRFGSFERKRPDLVKALANFTVTNYFPHLLQHPLPLRYEHFFYEVAEKTAELIAKWQSFGFTHGVMNTDNMSILGITLDHDRYDKDLISNGSDDEGRYSFQNQPPIARWNLEKLSKALSPLFTLGTEKEIEEAALGRYDKTFESRFYELMTRKLGLPDTNKDLVDEMLEAIQGTDYTLFFRKLSKIPIKDTVSFTLEWISRQDSYFSLLSLLPPMKMYDFSRWFEKYFEKINALEIDDKERAEIMDNRNPAIIFRNWIGQEIIRQAEKKNPAPLNDLLEALRHPFQDFEGTERPSSLKKEFYELPPDWAHSLLLTCSS